MTDGALVFDRETLAQLERRFASLPDHFRPLLWLHATHPALDRFRAWLDSQVTLLEPTARRSFLSRLRDEARYTQVLTELATAYVARQPGYVVEHEPDLDGLTPDLLVTNPEGQRAIIEVWRRGQPLDTARRNASWGRLARAIQRIATPLALAVHVTSPDAVEPPSPEECRELVPVLRSWLKSQRWLPRPTLVHGRFGFQIVGDTTSGRAELVPILVSPRAWTCSITAMGG